MAEGYQFTSAEIKELAFRFDGIFLPDKPDKHIWFVEVQFQKVEEFYRQFITEIMLYLNQYAPVQDWRAVAIFPNRSTEPPRFLHYSELFASERVKVVYLNEIEAESPYIGLIKLIITPEDRVIAPAQELVLKHRQVSGLLEFVETILAYKLKNLTREEIEAMFTLGDLKQTRVYQDAYQEGKLRTILRILNRKFGTLSPELTNQITSLSIERLDDLADAVLDFQTLDDLVRWLA